MHPLSVEYVLLTDLRKNKPMKNNQLLWGILGIAAGILSAQGAPDAGSPAAVKNALTGVSNLELPSKTAGLVAAASEADRKAVAVSAVQAAVTMNPSASAAIVSAVAAKVPAAAPAAAAAAAQLQPDQAARIAGAAAKAAPDQAAAIVGECSQKLPSQYASIAVAASKAAPDSSKDILAAASAASPAPVRANLAAAAKSGSYLPVDVSIARASAINHGGIFDRDPSGRGNDNDKHPGDDHPGRGGDHDHGNGWGPRNHSGCPVFGY